LVAQVFAFTPIAFLVLIGVVEGVSPSMRKRRRRCAPIAGGCSPTPLPLMRPGLANAFLISFIESIADFGNPILLGGNGVLSTEIFFGRRGAARPGARRHAWHVAGFAFGAFFLQRAVLGHRFTSLAGKGDGLAHATACRRAPLLTASRCRGRRSPSSSTPFWPAASSRPGAATTR
jgi:iron(III) transport system permease protein